jgi:hypothetical protein
MNTVEFVAGKTWTQNELKALSIPRLIDLHNQIAVKIGVKTIKSFYDKEAVVDKVAKLLEHPLAKTVAAETATVRKHRSRRFVFAPFNTVRKVKSGSNRAKLVELLTRPEGATFEQCLSATWGLKKATKGGQPMTPKLADKYTYEGIRLVHYYLGYGLRQDDDSTIHAYTTNDPAKHIARRYWRRNGQ